MHRDPQAHVLKRKYFEAPLPRWNWIKNRFLARSFASEVEVIAKENPDYKLWFIAHSNGAVITLLVVRALIERGLRVEGVILTGAACEADINKNGILDWALSDALGDAIAYCSHDDQVLSGDVADASSPLEAVRAWLWGKLMWPYGCLGRTGWKTLGAELSSKRGFSVQLGSERTTWLAQRWFPGGHSAYFDKERIRETFEQMYRDMTDKGDQTND